AMDDFGTGYSSLACLKSLSCDIVKIDRAFVTNITENDFDQRLVKSTIDICHSINIKCCIEGVETEDEYNMVTDNCGADSIQGYLFGRPEPQQVFIDKYLSKKTEE
ncbi:MAG: EAL domain-containing protein, partial [Selenomonadales bacterium]|nr:EAL domain-containing protein [Selenomonadales bacterium]